MSKIEQDSVSNLAKKDDIISKNKIQIEQLRRERDEKQQGNDTMQNQLIDIKEENRNLKQVS